jgi:hypothetical protein
MVLDRALGGVAGVRLVQREDQQLDRGHRHGHVDRDAAAQVAEVRVVPEPRYVPDDLQLDALAVGQLDEIEALRPRLGDDRGDRGPDPVGGYPDRLLPAPVPRRQRPGAGQQRVEPLVRGGEDGLVGAGRADAVAALDLVGVRAVLAGQHAGEGTQAGDLVTQPAVGQLAEQRFGVGDEYRRVHRRRRLDRSGQRQRADVRVDDAVHVPADLEAQPEVPFRRRFGHRLRLQLRPPERMAA